MKKNKTALIASFILLLILVIITFEELKIQVFKAVVWYVILKEHTWKFGESR